MCQTVILMPLAPVMSDDYSKQHKKYGFDTDLGHEYACPPTSCDFDTADKCL